MNKQKLFRRIKIFIICYCLVGSALYYLQDNLFFKPKAVNADSAYHFQQPFLETNIRSDSATNFNIVQFTVPDSIRKGLVIYFHGNRENVNRYAKFTGSFTRNQYEVWMPDYPGYGKSTGEFSEKVLYEEALQVYKLARTKYQPSQIVIYGKSLGTGIASQLASIRDCKALVLETPYYSFTSLVRLIGWMYPVDMMCHYKFPTREYLPKVTAPITIFHGTSDMTVPYFNAKRLKPLLKSSDDFVTLEGGSHNDLFTFPAVQQKIDSILAK